MHKFIQMKAFFLILLYWQAKLMIIMCSGKANPVLKMFLINVYSLGNYKIISNVEYRKRLIPTT